MRQVRLRRVGLRSIFVLFLVLYGGVGLLVGGGLYVLSTSGLADTVGMTALDRLGPWSLALFPAVYGLLGGIAGVVGAALYNTAAAITGGIRLELEGSQAVEMEAPAGEESGSGEETTAAREEGDGAGGEGGGAGDDPAEASG